MLIHATNVQGLGASQVVKSFLDAASSLGFLENSTICLPQSGLLSEYAPERGRVQRYKRLLPNSISRLLECLFSKLFFSSEKTIVLGDIPLRGIKNQIVFVHQTNLVYPQINPNSGKSLGFRISRFLFSINNKFADKIIVQTGAVAEDLIKSYPAIKNKVVISPQPVPNWIRKPGIKLGEDRNKMILFYPAAFYPHKKHEFLISLNAYILSNAIDFSGIEIWLTLEEEHFRQFESISFLKNLGKLSPDEMNVYYGKVDALLFLSSTESYGLPLAEAIFLGIPIITVDFNYSQWMCGDTAYYFEPYSPESCVSAVKNFISDYKSGSLPDYEHVTDKFPKSWDVVAETFFNL